VANNQLSSVKTLLAHNPDVNKMTSNFETPLIISVKNQNAAIAEALVRGGADIDLADKYGATPIHYASLIGSFDMADLLLYYDVDCNKKANDGTTPLMAAIYSGYPDIADLLFQNGANLEARDNAGFTPLLIAAQNGDTLMMNLLIKEGVDIYEKNDYNYNALALAIESNQLPAVELLLEKGDKWTSAEKGGVNPYTVAYALGRKNIVELLEKKNFVDRQGLKIDEVSVSASVKFNIRDYFTGLSFSFKEPFLNAGFIAGCDIKPAYTRILLEAEENEYYQYYDKSSVVFAGIFKDFTVSEYAFGTKIAVSASLSTGYSFSSKFKGTNIAPENKFRIMPAAGVKFQNKHITIRADLEYMKTGFYHLGPIWLRIGVAYNSFLSKVRSPGKIIKWN
jgi:ankyrin repeat protein